MNHPVMIKGNKYGIRLVLDPDIPFDELLSMIGQRFKEAQRFFQGNVNMALTIDGRSLSDEQLDALLMKIKEETDLDISCVLDEVDEKLIDQRMQTDQPDPVTQEVNLDMPQVDIQPETEIQTEDITEAAPPKMVYENRETLLNNDSMFYKGTLRSGQSIESEGSIVILGDVNPGASVISSGNIIVIGRLKGMVHAGAAGNVNAFVLALSMNPMQIRIADAIARSSDKPKRRPDDEAKIAFLDQGNIYIEPVKKSVLNDIHL